MALLMGDLAFAFSLLCPEIAAPVKQRQPSR
jgi:hypothetical protein